MCKHLTLADSSTSQALHFRTRLQMPGDDLPCTEGKKLDLEKFEARFLTGLAHDGDSRQRL